jgi:ATP synthase protein I
MAPAEDRPSRSQTAQLVNLGTLLFACVAVGLAAGYFADSWLGTKPWLLLIGLGLGIAAAGVNFYRTIKTLNQQDPESGEHGRGHR